MANDIDLKIGIVTQADESGIKSVEQALAEVHRAAQEAATASGDAASQAAAKTEQAAKKALDEVKKLAGEMSKKPDSGGLSEGFDELDKKITSISDSKKMSALNGLSQALQGFAGGDLSRGISGVASSLFQLSGAIPLPGAGLAIAGLLTAVAAVWKAFGDDTATTKEQLNQFGETVRQEQDRLDKLGRTRLEWTQLKGSLKSINDEFKKTLALTDTLGDAILKVFNKNYSLVIADLREQLGLDPKNAEEIQRAISKAEREQAIVNNTLALDRVKAQLEASIEAANLEQKMIERRLEWAKEQNSTMESLQKAMTERYGSADALYNSSTSEQMRAAAIQDLDKEIAKLKSRLPDFDNAPKPGSLKLRNIFGPMQPLEEWAREQEQMMGKLDGLEKIREQLLNFNAIAQNYAEAQKYTLEGLEQDKQQLQQHMAETVGQVGNLTVAMAELGQSLKGADPELAKKAKETADGIRDFQEISRAIIEVGVESGTAAREVIQEVAELGSEVVETFGATADTMGAALERIKQDLLEKQAGAKALEEAIADAPEGEDVSAKVQELETMFSDIDALQKQILAAGDSGSAKIKETAATTDNAADEHEQASSRLGGVIRDGGKKVASDFSGAASGIKSATDELSATPLLEASENIIGSVRDMSNTAVGVGHFIEQETLDFKLKMNSSLANFKLGAGSLRDAAQSSAMISMDLARLVQSLAREVADIRFQVAQHTRWIANER